MGIADLLSGGGGAFLKWETPGTNYSGIITDVLARQARKYESTELATWDDGTAQMQVLLTLSTDYRDAGNPDDDGTRQLSINLWSGQKKALIAACKLAGVAEPIIGMGFKATHVEGIGNAKSPRVFVYELSAGPSVLATALAATTTVEATGTGAVSASVNPAETAKTLLGAGMGIDAVAQATGLPATTVAALANLIAA